MESLEGVKSLPYRHFGSIGPSGPALKFHSARMLNYGRVAKGPKSSTKLDLSLCIIYSYMLQNVKHGVALYSRIVTFAAESRLLETLNVPCSHVICKCQKDIQCVGLCATGNVHACFLQSNICNPEHPQPLLGGISFKSIIGVLIDFGSRCHLVAQDYSTLNHTALHLPCQLSFIGV